MTPSGVVTIADPEAGRYGVRFTGGAGDARAWPALAEAAELHARGEFSMPMAQTCPLAEGPQAHRVSEAGHVRGKLVLIVDS